MGPLYLKMAKIETAEAVRNAKEIAAVDGVDVLFIGPLDLSVSLGVPQQYDHPSFRDAVARVADANRNNGKAPGIQLYTPEQLDQTLRDGYTFVALGSDGGPVANGMRKFAAEFAKCKGRQTNDWQ